MSAVTVVTTRHVNCYRCQKDATPSLIHHIGFTATSLNAGGHVYADGGRNRVAVTHGSNLAIGRQYQYHMPHHAITASIPCATVGQSATRLMARFGIGQNATTPYVVLCNRSRMASNVNGLPLAGIRAYLSRAHTGYCHQRSVIIIINSDVHGEYGRWVIVIIVSNIRRGSGVGRICRHCSRISPTTPVIVRHWYQLKKHLVNGRFRQNYVIFI